MLNNPLSLISTAELRKQFQSLQHSPKQSLTYALAVLIEQELAIRHLHHPSTIHNLFKFATLTEY